MEVTDYLQIKEINFRFIMAEKTHNINSLIFTSVTSEGEENIFRRLKVQFFVQFSISSAISKNLNIFIYLKKKSL